MKQISIFLIVCIFFSNTNQVFAGDKYVESQISTQSEDYVTQAKLLDSYIISYTKDLQKSAQKYKVENHFFVTGSYTEIAEIKSSIKKIQSGLYSSNKSKSEIKRLVQKLKVRNKLIQTFFNRQQEIQLQITKSKQKSYTAYTLKLSRALDSFSGKITTVLLKKESYSSSEKAIAKVLLKLRNENNKLKNFSKKSFKNEAEMKKYLQTCILNIRGYISQIKKLAR